MSTLKSKPPVFLILAAGQGTRMKSDLPKVLTSICGRPLLAQILTRIQEASPRSPIGIVVGYQGTLVKETISSDPRLSDLKITYLNQEVRDGTGGAVRVAMNSRWGKKVTQSGAPVLVLPGDSPLITEELLSEITLPLKKAGQFVQGMFARKVFPNGILRYRINRESNILVRIPE